MSTTYIRYSGVWWLSSAGHKQNSVYCFQWIGHTITQLAARNLLFMAPPIHRHPFYFRPLTPEQCIQWGQHWTSSVSTWLNYKTGQWHASVKKDLLQDMCFVTNTLVHQYLQDTVFSYSEIEINGNPSKQVIVTKCPFFSGFHVSGANYSFANECKQLSWMTPSAKIVGTEAGSFVKTAWTLQAFQYSQVVTAALNALISLKTGWFILHWRYSHLLYPIALLYHCHYLPSGQNISSSKQIHLF